LLLFITNTQSVSTFRNQEIHFKLFALNDAQHPTS